MGSVALNMFSISSGNTIKALMLLSLNFNFYLFFGFSEFAVDADRAPINQGRFLRLIAALDPDNKITLIQNLSLKVTKSLDMVVLYKV